VKNVAFIGLGVMGSPMAINLVKGGYGVKGWNRTKNRPLVAQAETLGVQITPTIAEAVQDVDYIFTCVSDGKDVNSVIFDEGGIRENAKSNALIVDFSTIGTTAACAIASELNSYSLRFLDAPVSGGDVGAQKGTLTVMVGGEKSDFEECYPLLKTVGSNIIHCGKVGSGQGIKLCNQVLCAVYMMGLCEAMELAKILNVDPNLMIEVCATGAAGSWALNNLAPKIAQGDFAPGFMIKHIIKDLGLVRESLGEMDLPAVTLSDRLFKIVQGMGGGEHTTQAMIRAYDHLNL
jgi:3-hydroxyisobutyrate dehydrogenase